MTLEVKLSIYEEEISNKLIRVLRSVFDNNEDMCIKVVDRFLLLSNNLELLYQFLITLSDKFEESFYNITVGDFCKTGENYYIGDSKYDDKTFKSLFFDFLLGSRLEYMDKFIDYLKDLEITENCYSVVAEIANGISYSLGKFVENNIVKLVGTAYTLETAKINTNDNEFVNTLNKYKTWRI